MRLTCTEDGSSKFWEGTVEGASLTVFFGKIGTKGQTKTKEFPSAEKAQAELAKLIKEKLGKGYVEASPGEKPAAAPAMQESTKEAPKTEAPGKESPKKAGGKAGALARALAKLDPLEIGR